MKDEKNKEELEGTKLEEASGGRISIISTGEGIPDNDDDKKDRSGGATYTW